MRYWVFTIYMYTNHPGGNLVHKHKTTNFDSVGEQPTTNQQAWKSRNFSSPQITGYIFWGFPNWMVQIIWFSNWKFWFSHWFLIGPAFCEGILKQMKSLDVNQETPQKGNLYSYVYWKSTEKKKDKWHPPFRWCIQIHTCLLYTSPSPRD